MINTMRQQSNKITQLEKDNEERKLKEKESKEKDDSSSTAGLLGTRLMLTAGPGSPAPFAPNGLAPQPTGFNRGF